MEKNVAIILIKKMKMWRKMKKSVALARTQKSTSVTPIIAVTTIMTTIRIIITTTITGAVLVTRRRADAAVDTSTAHLV